MAPSDRTPLDPWNAIPAHRAGVRPRGRLPKLPKLRAATIGGALFAVAFLAFWLTMMINYPVWTMWNRYRLDHYGVLATAIVLRIEPPTADDGGGGGNPRLDVRINACACIARVDAATDTHPVGSTIEVRYDPADPTHAIAVEDPPEPDLSFVSIVAVFMAGTWTVRRAQALLRRRRGRAQRPPDPTGGPSARATS